MDFFKLDPSTVAVKVLAVVLLAGVCYAWGRSDGAALADAEALREERLVQAATDKALEVTAEAIKNQGVKNVTIQRRVERETRNVPVYVDCRHTAGGLRSINAALENRTEPAGGGELPAQPGPAGR